MLANDPMNLIRIMPAEGVVAPPWRVNPSSVTIR
jgi:hypothetical protein